MVVSWSVDRDMVLWSGSAVVFVVCVVDWSDDYTVTP